MPDQKRELEGKLKDSANEDPHRQGIDGGMKEPVQENYAPDHGKVQEDGRKGRWEEDPVGIENPHAKGDQTDEKDVGENNLSQGDRKGEFLRKSYKSGSDKPDEIGGEENPRGRDHQEKADKEGKAACQEVFYFSAIPLLDVVGEDRDERDSHGSFADQSSQKVG